MIDIVFLTLKIALVSEIFIFICEAEIHDDDASSETSVLPGHVCSEISGIKQYLSEMEFYPL